MKVTLVASCLLALAAAAPGKIEMDVEELLDMVPYEQMVNLGMEYAIADPQVKSLMQYISSDKFRDNIIALESSPQFLKLAEVSASRNLDVFALANKFNSALDMPALDYRIGYHRQKRNPGDGLTGLVRDAAELTPLDDMKEMYKYKVDHNPEFKNLMTTLLSGEAREAIAPIVNSKPFQDIKQDLKDLGIPLEQLEQLVTEKLTTFFDIAPTTVAPS